MVWDCIKGRDECWHCGSTEHDTAEHSYINLDTRPPNHPNAIIVDMDGTLAIHNGRSPYEFMRCEEDLVNEPIKHIVNKYALDHIILIVSGRDDIVKPHCIRWLTKHNIHYDDIMMRVTGDKRSDDIVKEEIYNNFIKEKYNVRFILDDRNRVVVAWRRMGLTCLQVAEGNF